MNYKLAEIEAKVDAWGKSTDIYFAPPKHLDLGEARWLIARVHELEERGDEVERIGGRAIVALGDQREITRKQEARVHELEARAALDAKAREVADAALEVGENRLRACWMDWGSSNNHTVRNDAGIWPPLIEATKQYRAARAARGAGKEE